jgi:hypothetical protein
MQEIARELELLRKHNLKFKQGDSQGTLLLIAEASVVCLALERFLRIVLADKADERDTLPNLLEKATSRRLNLISLPFDNQKDGIKRVVLVRNTLLHGNYEQAAHTAGCTDVPHYFKTIFASETERMFDILNHVMKQIDSATGLPVSKMPGGA